MTRYLFYVIIFLVMLITINCGGYTPIALKYFYPPEQYLSNGKDTLRVNFFYFLPQDDFYLDHHYLFYYKMYLNGAEVFTSNTVDTLLKYPTYPGTPYEYRIKIDTVLIMPTGIYKFRGWMDRVAKNNDKLKDDKTTSTSLWADYYTHITKVCDETLIVWCGDLRYGNLSERLQWYNCYPLCARVYDKFTQWGIPGREVLFSSNEAYIWEDHEYVLTDSIRLYGCDDFYQGLAVTYCSLNTFYDTNYIQISYNNIFDTLSIICQNDNETVVDTLRIHEYCSWDTLKQIPGDGLWVGDPNASKKDLKIEIDYDGTIINTTLIDQVMAIVRDSLFSPINVSINYNIDNNTGFTGKLDRKQQEGLLASNRNSNNTGIGKGSLHLIFASMYYNAIHPEDTLNVEGIAVCFDDYQEEGWGLSKCAHYASGLIRRNSVSQAYLDSVGCIIFSKAVMYKGGWGDIDTLHRLALVVAHEIGHAIGLGHTGGPEYQYHGIMSYSFGTTVPYIFYSQFVKPNSTDYNNLWLICLRKILGRENISISW